MVKAKSRMEIVGALRRHGAYKVDERGGHEKWRCSCGEEHQTQVPRHRQITAPPDHDIDNESNLQADDRVSTLRGRVVAVSECKTYDAKTWREEGFWVIDIDELGLTTQARRLDQVEYMARDAIALWLDVPEESFDIAVQRRIPEEIASRVGDLSEARERANRAQAEAAAEARDLARSLREAGYPMRDIGELLGVSYQRAQQLAAPPRAS